MRARKLSVSVMLEGTFAGALQRQSFGAKLINLDQYEHLLDYLRHHDNCAQRVHGRECSCGLDDFLSEGLAPEPSDE